VECNSLRLLASVRICSLVKVTCHWPETFNIDLKTKS